MLSSQNVLLYNYWEYVVDCVFAVEGHIILKIWLIFKKNKNSSCSSLSTSDIEYGKLTEDAKQSKYFFLGSPKLPGFYYIILN
jgi:hypothetical protein